MCCPFSPLDVLDEIWDVIESVSDGFLTYSTFRKEIAPKNIFLPLNALKMTWHSYFLFKRTYSPQVDDNQVGLVSYGSYLV